MAALSHRSGSADNRALWDTQLGAFAVPGPLTGAAPAAKIGTAETEHLCLAGS